MSAWAVLQCRLDGTEDSGRIDDLRGLRDELRGLGEPCHLAVMAHEGDALVAIMSGVVEALLVAMAERHGAIAHVWSPRSLRVPETGFQMRRNETLVVVERAFDPPMSAEYIAVLQERGEWCLEVHAVRFVDSRVSADGTRMVCIFAARDAESVRKVSETIGLPYERIWAASRDRASDPVAARSNGAAVRILDTSVRDGLTGLRVETELRWHCIEAIAAMGVDIVEVGMVASDRDDDGLIRRAAERLRGVRVCCLAHPTDVAIRRAGEAVASAESARLHVFNPIRAAGDAKGRLDEIVRTVKMAREACEDVEWSALDATRTSRRLLLEAVAAAVEAGARTIGIPDTRGHALPSEMAEIIGAVRGVIGERDDVVISAHCHDDLGLGLANSLAAVSAGARQVECTLGGVGPQGGNTDLAKVVVALRARADALPACGDLELSLVEEASRRLAACRPDGAR